MQQPIYESALFKDCAQAEARVERLAAIGYDRDEISIIFAEDDGLITGVPDSTPNDLGSAGARIGGVLGAIIGVAGSAVAIVGTAGAATPFVIGPLALALAGLGGGAVTGAIVGGLLELGDHADDWHDWVEKGGVVVAVALKSADDREQVRAALA
jgi:hypothetical protein